jgi:hypothetical protein
MVVLDHAAIKKMISIAANPKRCFQVLSPLGFRCYLLNEFMHL